MEIKRKIEITISKRKKFVVRQAAETEQTFCGECGEPMLAAEQTADIFGISRREIYRLVESGAGVLLVCPNSLTEIPTEENL